MNSIQANLAAATNQVAADSNGTVVAGSQGGFAVQQPPSAPAPQTYAGLSLWAWVGIAIAVFLLCIIIAVVFVVFKLKRNSEERV